MIGAPGTPARLPAPPRERDVQVEALAASWCIDGRTVTVGQRYTIPASTATALEATGKAKRAA